MNLDHDFVQVWKFSEDQKKNANGTHFFSNSGENQKKRSSSKIEHFFPQIQVKTKTTNKNRTLFSPNFRSDVHPFKLLWCADVDHSQTIGGDTAKLLGGYIPPSPPCFGTPVGTWLLRMQNFKIIFQDWIPVTLRINKEIIFCKKAKNKWSTSWITPHVCYDDSRPTKSSLIQ